MKTQKLDALRVWKQIEDQLVPSLRLNLTERVVYYHLLRHSRLEGHLQRRLTAAELAGRLHALDAPVAGDLRPVLPAPKPKFAVGAPNPTPPSYKRFPVWSVSYPRKPRPPQRKRS